MKKTTKFWLGVSAVGGGIWAWMKYGDKAAIAASRVAPPGYTSTRYLTDPSGKQVAMQFIYPPVESDSVGKFSRVLTVPIDARLRGTWSTVRA